MCSQRKINTHTQRQTDTLSPNRAGVIISGFILNAGIPSRYSTSTIHPTTRPAPYLAVVTKVNKSPGNNLFRMPDWQLGKGSMNRWRQ